MRTIRFCFLPLGLALCLLLPVSPLATAQDSPPSASELRRENEQLRIRIDELEAQLARSQESIDQLLEQVRRLNAQVAELKAELEARREPASESPTPQDDAPAQPQQIYAELPESQPFAAPEAMFRAVIESYRATFGDISIPFESSDARNRYLRDAEAWSKSIKRSLRNQVEWTIEVRRIISSERDPLVLEYRVVDPVSRLPYSERVYALEVPTRFERRVLQDRSTAHWQLRAVAGAATTINRERESIGFFDVRPFVGPYVEFGIDLSVSSIVPAPQQQEPESDTASESPNETGSGAGAEGN